MTSQPQSQGTRKIQRPVFLRSQRLWVCPTKAPCASVVTVMATATTELRQSWRSFPPRLSLIVHSLIMFPVRGLNKSSSSESQAVARSGGPPRLLGKQSPRGPSGAEEWAPCKREGALPGRGWELQSPQLWDSSCAPGSSSPQPTRLGVRPLGKLRESLACSGCRGQGRPQ